VLHSDKAAPEVGAHAVFGASTNETVGDWGDGTALRAAAHHASEALAAGRRGLVREVGSAEIAYEIVTPAVRLIVCGSGPDAAPVARFASQLGWDVTVVDHRPVTSSHAQRFTGARVVECNEALELPAHVSLTPRTAAVVMSHNFTRDRDYVRALLGAELAYIGVLGPRARTERMLSEIPATEAARARESEKLFSPVGMDIGGEGPDAIALAIISQVSTVASGRTGGHLRDRRAPLHQSSSRDATPAPA
jgi:xanthine dehydrogenase accessory factor